MAKRTFNMIKSGDGFRLYKPSEKTLKEFEKVPEGQVLKVAYITPRNLKFHNKLFALLKFMYNNLEWDKMGVTQPTFEAFRKWVLIQIGHFDVMQDPKGGYHLFPGSISFEALSQEQFEDVYDKILTLAYDLLPGYKSKEELEEVIARLRDFE